MIPLAFKPSFTIELVNRQPEAAPVYQPVTKHDWLFAILIAFIALVCAGMISDALYHIGTGQANVVVQQTTSPG